MALSKEEGLAEAERRIAVCRKGREPLLDISNLDLERVPDAVATLTWLSQLRVGYNPIRELPDYFDRLASLNMLSVGGLRVQTLPSSLLRHHSLRSLYLDGSSVLAVDIPPTSLSGLTALSLTAMRLRDVPECVRGMSDLMILYIDGNKIDGLPAWLRELPGLTRLILNGNPLGLPQELEHSRDARKILDYYFRVHADPHPRPLNEYKLILVGRGAVGKTTLVHKLITDKFQRFDRTPGIQVTPWPTPIDGEEVRAHVWDFGGQEILHGTHRFFMTQRALYLVLISGREGTEDRDAEYWLSMVRSFAGDAPVIVLLHKWSDYRFELNREQLRQKYGQNLVFVETDSEDGHGIDQLRTEICRLAKSLPGIKAAWPSQWRDIKAALPKEQRAWLAFDDFRGFCREHGIPDEKDQEALCESLHDLGLILSYRAEPALRDVGVLNPQWVTTGIYAMLNALPIRDAGGRFDISTFARILPEAEYPKELHSFLLALMRKFQLCHPLDDNETRFLIPELLTKEEPRLDAEFPPGECLGFVYRYEAVLPEGLLPRFIVDTYVHGEPKQAWRTGVVLERANCRALVRGDVQGRTVAIRVTGVGNGRRELLGIVREHFERIHRSYERLPVTELVPIPDHPEAAPVKHQLLLKYERDGRKTIAVEVGDALDDFDVTRLLDGVDLPGAPRASTRSAWGTDDKRLEGVTVFICYSRKDAVFRDQLKGALVTYERKGELRVWADELIEPGQTWEDEIVRHLDEARIVIPLLSNDFFASDYCFEKELPRAQERRKKGECEIIPVVVRACRYEKTEVGLLQAIVPGGKPVDEHPKHDAAWLEVTKQLDVALARVGKR